MRLKPKEVTAIVEVLRTKLEPVKGELFLFGSRADDQKKGGDIDLLVVVPTAALEILQEEKTKILDLIQERIGEQRLDMTIVTPERWREDLFFNSLKPAPIRLYP